MKRALWRLLFGQAQIFGGTIAVYLLLATGISKATIIATAATALVSFASRLMFGVVEGRCRTELL